MSPILKKEQLLRLTVGYVDKPANTRQCTWIEFMGVLCDIDVMHRCNEIADLPYDAEHKKKIQELKKSLPVFCFNSKRESLA